jgi:hypothetical protein
MSRTTFFFQNLRQHNSFAWDWVIDLFSLGLAVLGFCEAKMLLILELHEKLKKNGFSLFEL